MDAGSPPTVVIAQNAAVQDKSQLTIFLLTVQEPREAAIAGPP